MLMADKAQVARIVEDVFVAARGLKDGNGLRVVTRTDLDKADGVYDAVLKAIEIASGMNEPVYRVRPEPLPVGDLSGFMAKLNGAD